LIGNNIFLVAVIFVGKEYGARKEIQFWLTLGVTNFIPTPEGTKQPHPLELRDT
jgi:hypothetical protein